MQPGLLIVISGPGAVGKDTLIERLRERHPELRYSVSYTTRPRRPYEVEGEHYTFVDRDTFRRMVDEGAFLEHATVNGHWYGTSAERVAELQEAGHDVILKIDVQGADQVRAKRPDGVFVFLAPPSMEEAVAPPDRPGRRTSRRGAGPTGARDPGDVLRRSLRPRGGQRRPGAGAPRGRDPARGRARNPRPRVMRRLRADGRYPGGLGTHVLADGGSRG